MQSKGIMKDYFELCFVAFRLFFLPCVFAPLRSTFFKRRDAKTQRRIEKFITL